MRYIGIDCWNVIYNYKEDLELMDHKKKFSSTLKTIRDKISYTPDNLIDYKILDLYLETVNIVSCDTKQCSNIHIYRMMDSFRLNDVDYRFMYNEEHQCLDRILSDYLEDDLIVEEIEEQQLIQDQEILDEYIKYIDYE